MNSNKNVQKSKKRKISRKPKSKKSSVQFVKKNIKPKVKLDSSKVIMLCVGIIVFCVLLLVATFFIPVEPKSKSDLKSVKNQTDSQKIEKIQKEEKNDKKNSTVTQKNKNQVEIKNSEKKEEQKKSSVKTQKSEVSENSKNNVDKNSSSSIDDSSKKENFTKKDDSSKSVAPPKNPVVQETDIQKFAKEIPDAKNGDKIILVFDDGGQNLNHLKKFLSLPFPISIAVMPKLQYSAQAGSMVRDSGKELMLHQPMQSVNLKINPGPGAITPEMSVAEIQSLLKENIAEIGPIAGINNHEGSLITEDETRIGAVMEVCAEKNIFFLDSRTSSQTRVPQVAMSMGYGYFQRDVFLDNQKTRENILSEIKRGIGIANKKGHVVMIGHVWSADILPDILMEVYPILQKKGYRFFTVSKSGTAIFP